MNTTTLLLLAGAAYLLYSQGYLRAPMARAPARPTPTYEQTPAGTSINLPGIGTYRSAAGGTQLTVDPGFFDRLLGGLFRGGTPGEGAQPSRAFLPEGSPALPSSSWSNVSDVSGGALDAWRAGERDPALDITNIPLDPLNDPAAFVPADPGPLSPTLDPCEVDPSWCGAAWDGYEWAM